MSGLSIGLSTFNSCNKAGSIPHFTQHLSRYPNDYQALVWRGRAYSIIGKTAEANADFQKACCVSRGPKKCLVEALIEHLNGNMKQEGAILDYTTRQYPNCSEAWSELGCYTRNVQKKVDPALQHLGRAYQLATDNSETKEPWFPWCSQTIGDIYYYEKQEVDQARKYYAAAVQSGNTLTIGHLGLSRCDILNNKLASAQTSFLTAKRLNPDLVQCDTFDDFLQQTTLSKLASQFLSSLLSLFSETTQSRDASSSQYFSGATHQAQGRRSASEYQGGRNGGSGGRGNGGSGDGSGSDVQKFQEGYYLRPVPDHGNSRFTRDEDFRMPIAGHQQTTPSKLASPFFSATTQSRDPSSSQYFSGARHQAQGRRSASGYQGGRNGGSGGRGNGGSGDGSGSDDDDLTPEERERRWAMMKTEAPSVKKYRGKRFYQSKCKSYWYSKIHPSERHGRETKSFLKKYEDRGATIKLIGSLDENLKEMFGKHESGKYDLIKKSDMDGI